MSKINIYDVDVDVEYADETEETDLDQLASRQQKNCARRRIENLMECKKLKEMMSTEDSYWGD